MTLQQKEIQKKLKKVLDKERYEHSMGVMYTSACLAMNYGYDMERAMLAGLLHDCAKNVSDEEKIRLCRENNMSISEVEMEHPFLLHAKLGAFYAKNIYHVSDAEVLHAIEVHTTGALHMGLLDKILFAADFIEPNRDKVPNLASVRNLCFLDLDRGVLRILHDTLEYLSRKKSSVDETTRETYEYYKKWLEEDVNGIS